MNNFQKNLKIQNFQELTSTNRTKINLIKKRKTK